jgi:hypothetical protein
MGEITILTKKYALPDTRERLQSLTQEIQRRVHIIKTGAVPVPRLMGIFPRQPKKLSAESCFTEIEKLVENYSQIIAQLKENKERYLEFFSILSNDVERAMKERAQQIREAEEERQRLQHELESNDAGGSISWIQEQEERLREAVRILGASALLLLKKLSLCKQGIETLSRDHDMQRTLLERLRNMLSLHRRMYVLDQKISRIESDVKQMAQMALHFEEYLRDYFGPLQVLLEQVFRVDKSLSIALSEIETIAQDLGQQHNPLPESILDILVGPQLQTERMQQLAEQLSFDDNRFDRFETALITRRASVEDGIANITMLVNSRLLQLNSNNDTKNCETCTAPMNRWGCEQCAVF